MKYLFVLCFIVCSFSPFAQQHNQPIRLVEVDSLKKQEPELWYADSLPYNRTPASATPNPTATEKTKKETPKEIEREKTPFNFTIPEGIGEVLKWLFYGILLVAVLLLIFKGNFNFSFSTNKSVDFEVTETSKIETAEQLQTIGYEGQIKRAEEEQNYRLAIRLHYLWTLKKLIDGNLISFHLRKTNMDYCQELKKSTVYDSFYNCTQFYNYVWFGEFSINQEIYNSVKATFNELLVKL